MIEYILFRLHRALRQSINLCLLSLLSSHRLLDDIIHFVLVALMKDGRILSRLCLLLMMNMVPCACSMNRAFRINGFRAILMTMHLHVLQSRFIRVCIVLVQFDHGELLL